MARCPSRGGRSSAAGSDLTGLVWALRRLDGLLERAVTAAEAAYGPEAAADPFRGLHISREDVERLLAREPGAPTFRTDGGGGEESPPGSAGPVSRLAWLAEACGLSPFDLDLVLIALAPEIDLRYERLYAYLQDDVTRRRPSVDLALNLLCPSAAEKLARRAHFASDAPLIKDGLLHLITDPAQLEPPLLAHYLKLDDQIVRLLLGTEGLDSRLTLFCQLVEPAVSLVDLPLAEETKAGLRTLVVQAREACQPLRFYFCGPRGMGKRRAAEAVAAETGTSLLVVDLLRAHATDADLGQAVRLVFREAWLHDAILYLEGLDTLLGEGRAVQHGRLVDALVEDAGITILAGARPWVPSGRDPIGVMTVRFPMPAFPRRRQCWEVGLAAAGLTFEARELDALAARFRLTAEQIAEAVVTAYRRAEWRAAPHSLDGLPDARPTMSDLFAAARALPCQDLTALAQKIEPVFGWDDIVLPEEALAQLREICQRVAFRQRVLAEWGFDRKLSLGKGVNALFTGPSGTGKTMAADIIANELGLDLYKIDLSGVVSKYIGETEKNLDRVFAAAENANAILFFDEADALFGKRSEVRDSHDRYANIEISYLLQKMEQYDGIAILATNLGKNLDEAFPRRLAFTVHFPFPEEPERRRIWTRIWPAETPLSDDVDLNFLAHQFKLSGGNIKNIALAAAFLAAADGGAVTMAHLFHATRREYEKLGKVLSAAELYGARDEAQARGKA